MCDTPTVPDHKSPGTGRKEDSAGRAISLKELAKHLKLSPTTLSLVLNDSPGAASIPQETKNRIFAAYESITLALASHIRELASFREAR